MAPPGAYSMTTDVIVYISSVANPRKHPRKIACLESFAAGAKRAGASVHVEWANQYRPSKLAVILGWATTNTGGPNIQLRKQIIAEQQRHGFNTMCIDASCFKYLDNHGAYLRYSLGGPFYDRAEYANKNSSDAKWLEISNALRIKLASPQHNPNGHILVCMQRDGGFSMKSLDPITWLKEKIVQIRANSIKPIMVRPHPGAYDPKDFDIFRSKHYGRLDVHIIDPSTTRLIDNLRGAYAAVFFNSSASVAAVCEGIPIFVDDSSCVSWDVANTDITKIESPQTFAREQWINNLAAAHWSDQDAQAGRIYQKFKPFL